MRSQITKEINSFLKKEYTNYTSKQLSEVINEKFGVYIKKSTINGYCLEHFGRKGYRIKISKEQLNYLKNHIDECNSYLGMARLLLKKYKFRVCVYVLANYLKKTKFKPRNTRYKINKVIPEEQLKFLKDNINNYTHKNLCIAFNKKFHRRLPKEQICKILKRLKIVRKRLIIDDEKINYLKKLYNECSNMKEVERKFYEKYNYVLTKLYRQLLSKKYGFKYSLKEKRNIRFEDYGTEKLRGDGKLYTKIIKKSKDGNLYPIWEEKRRVEYEKVNGKIPPGYVLISLDGNPNNCNMDNLMVISKNTYASLKCYGWHNLPKNLISYGIKYCDLMKKFKENVNK